MRQIFRVIVVLFVFGGLAAAPAWPEEVDQAGKAPLQQIGSPVPPQEQQGSLLQKGDEGMGGGMMGDSMNHPPFFVSSTLNLVSLLRVLARHPHLSRFRPLLQS